MRENKFRGQRSDNKEWVFGNLLKTSVDKKPDPEFTDGIQVFENGTFKAVHAVISKTVGQFYMNLQTYDNEVQSFDAYEGDIIEVGRYTPTKYYTVIIEDIRKKPDNLFGDSVVSRKLLGNIHSNPELLK
ncbi:YopX family protein [Chryseobacterium sp. X308]|uniref:YopX family protein n=1 Tax=Chryseobacterium sp. X308 TaxID=2884873 RepID=UPI001D13443C|nr:YopX family protein [Chryseobacterium sp. X308]MCC3214978.1 YopX family protein [Chryseobacterium sp. X308]